MCASPMSDAEYLVITNSKWILIAMGKFHSKVMSGQWTIHTIHGKMGDEMKVEKKQWKWQKILAPIFEQTSAERSRSCLNSSLRSAHIVTALISRVFPYDNLFATKIE